jgi:hypothetical protein
MTYDGAMVMPRNSVAMSNDEMTYVEGGNKTVYNTASKLKGAAQTFMNAYGVLANTGGVVSLLVANALKVYGLPFAGILSWGVTHWRDVSGYFNKAYNYFSTKSQTSSKLYYMTIINTMGSYITGVSYGAA